MRGETGPDFIEALARGGQVPLRYADAAGDIAADFPEAPNGAEQAAAAICNAQGNVLAMMPHPELAVGTPELAPTRPVLAVSTPELAPASAEFASPLIPRI